MATSEGVEGPITAGEKMTAWLLPPITLPGRKREYHRVLWIIAAIVSVHILMHLPGEYSLLVALILAALLPAFG